MVEETWKGIHFLGIICPVWLLPSRLNRLTPRDVVALPKELNNDPGYFEEEPAVVLVHESLPLESVHREQERFHRLPVPCGSNQHGTRILEVGVLRKRF